MNVARIAVLAIAIGAGGLAMILAGGSGEEPVVEVEAPQMDTVEVLVAAKPISMGTAISSSELNWQSWPADAPVSGFITRSDRPGAMDEIAGRITRHGFIAGEPISELKIVDAERGFLSAILPKGMRAVSTEISPETGAGGFILPNDRVDVILTRRDAAAEEAGAGEIFISETILANVRVLAIDQTIEEQDGNQVVVGSTATLEVAPSQAEILALSEQLGDVSLALRSLEDSVPGAEDEVASGRQGRITVMQFGVSRQVIPR